MTRLSACAFCLLLVSTPALLADEPVTHRGAVAAPPRGSVTAEGPTSDNPRDLTSSTLRRSAGSRWSREDGAGRPRAGALPSPTSGVGALGMAWPLIVVLGCITALAVLARRWLPRAALSAGGGAMQVLGRHYLSNKQSLCLVRVGGRVLLLGVTPEHIRSLSVMEDSAESSAILAAAERERPDSFTSSLARMSREADRGEPDIGREDGSGWSQAAGNVRGLLDRVRAISGKGASAEPA